MDGESKVDTALAFSRAHEALALSAGRGGEISLGSRLGEEKQASPPLGLADKRSLEGGGTRKSPSKRYRTS